MCRVEFILPGLRKGEKSKSAKVKTSATSEKENLFSICRPGFNLAKRYLNIYFNLQKRQSHKLMTVTNDESVFKLGPAKIEISATKKKKI